MPRSRRARTPSEAISWFASVMRPPATWCNPATASSTSAWPLPSTPTSPTTSPARTLRSSPATTSLPRALTTRRPSICATTAPSPVSARSTRRAISRPTIMVARLCSVTSLALTWPTVLPCRMTVIVSEISSTSGSLWAMKMTVQPCSTSERTATKSSDTSCGASTAVGSSRIRMRARRYSALRISTRCCCPTGRERTGGSGSTCSRYFSLSARTSAIAFSRSKRWPWRGSDPSTTFS